MDKYSTFVDQYINVKCTQSYYVLVLSTLMQYSAAYYIVHTDPLTYIAGKQKHKWIVKLRHSVGFIRLL